MNNIIFTNDILVTSVNIMYFIYDFLTDDEKQELAKIGSLCIQETDTFVEFNVTDKITELMHKLFLRFIDELDLDTKYSIKTLFENKTNVISLNFKKSVGTAIDWHYDSWSDWNFVCSIGGHAKLYAGDNVYDIFDKTAYLFNGATTCHKIVLLASDDTRQCVQLRHYDYDAFMVQQYKMNNDTDDSDYKQHLMRYTNKKQYLKELATLFKQYVGNA